MTKVSLEKRLQFHLHTKTGRCHRVRWIMSLVHQGLKPKIEIIQVCDSHEDMCEAEKFHIEYMRSIGYRLTNTAQGGLGGCSHGPLTREHKAKISEGLKGKKKTPEHIAKVAAAQRGKPRVIKKIRSDSRLFTDGKQVFHGKTQAARILGCTQETIHNILSGRSKLSMVSLRYLTPEEVQRLFAIPC